MQATVETSKLAECLSNNCACAMQLLERGRTVVAAARDAAKAKEVFSELGLKEGINEGSSKVCTYLSFSIARALPNPELSVLSLTSGQKL